MKAPYSQFVAITGQQNGPPGGIGTIRQWIQWGQIDESATVLDLACSTGFSGITAMGSTHCRVLAVDIDRFAVEAARTRASGVHATDQYRAARADASMLPLADKSVSHILAGCTFGFFEDAEGALTECSRVLQDDGYLCVSPFFFTRHPPSRLIAAADEVLGYRLAATPGSDRWHHFFSSHFTEMHRVDAALAIPSDRDLAAMCLSTLSTPTGAPRAGTELIQRMLYERLVIRELNKYQGYYVAVLKPRRH